MNEWENWLIFWLCVRVKKQYESETTLQTKSLFERRSMHIIVWVKCDATKRTD